ncbi:MAG: S1/P1 nuclease [Candidatus Cyclobacteriaceae bacterium M2_1C_046]
MRILIIALLLFINVEAFSWGQIGHRTVGHIAEKYLNRKARKNIRKLMDNQRLSYISTWMDEIKADSLYDFAYTWHWVTIPDEYTYDIAEKNSEGDIIMTIERLIKELEAGGLDKKTEQEHIMMLVHLIGDIHQPLHVGTGEDQGGNDVKVEWFWESSNLHRVWDSEMINSKQLSSIEFAHSIDHQPLSQVKEWQQSSVIDWAMESIALRGQVYDLPENKRLGYNYMYKNWETVEQRVLQAGVRLAAVLNKIYG